jgi:hypothetical protein
MEPEVNEGTVILRKWDRNVGLTETTHAFHSLNALYALCLATDAPEVIDRIVIHGHDSAGQPRVLTFTFQSITVSPK